MEKIDFWKNLTGTVYALGVMFYALNPNSTPVIMSAGNNSAIRYIRFEDRALNSTNKMIVNETDHIYIQQKATKLDIITRELFGQMRDATSEEAASINLYIRSISKDTGVNFFDLC